MKQTVCCSYIILFVVSDVVYLFTCFFFWLFFTAISVSFDRELYRVTEGSANFISYLIINIAGQTEIDLLSSVVITFTDGSATSKSMNIQCITSYIIYLQVYWITMCQVDHILYMLGIVL